jgi:cation transport ATPase
MISAFIFFLHLIFALVIFTRKWQNDSLKSGVLNLGLIAVLFAVGWSITGIIAKVVMEEKGLGLYFDRDTFSLTLLTIGEYFFYRIYYREPTEAGTEIQ